jgi:hypothetical protein
MHGKQDADFLGQIASFFIRSAAGRQRVVVLEQFRQFIVVELQKTQRIVDGLAMEWLGGHVASGKGWGWRQRGKRQAMANPPAARSSQITTGSWSPSSRRLEVLAHRLLRTMEDSLVILEQRRKA